ncbi:MAG: SWIM zinc finger family protein [Chloroflexi bacterium]|nr:SWIM zinc finger family protein [Chloroflexota bacterium]
MVTTIDTTDPRSLKALSILEGSGQWLKCRTKDGRKAFGIPSQSEPNKYHLVDCQSCTCQDYQRRGGPCKHITAVRLYCARAKAQQPRPRHEAAPLAHQSRIGRMFHGDGDDDQDQ